MDIFDEVQFDQTAWAEQKKAQRQAVYEQIDSFLDNMPLEESSLQQYLTVQGRFPQCSVGNAVLIAAQRPDTTEYHTFDDWKAKDASINKNEKGFFMLKAEGTYTGRDGKTHTNYEVRRVFDISQTNATPKPAQQDVRTNLKALLIRPVCPVQVVEQQTGAVFVPEENKVEIGRGMNVEDAMRSITMALAHGELSKRILDYKPGQPQNSFYARCASYIVCTRYGVEPKGYTFRDIQSALGPCNSQEMRGHLETIRSTAFSLIDRAEKVKAALLTQAKSVQPREQEQKAR